MPFLSDIWYAAAWNHEVTADGPFATVIADRAVVLYRLPDGAVAALEDKCSHRCAPLSKGRIERDGLRCWYHGLLFGPDGTCRDMPGQDGVARGFDIRAYAAVEREAFVWLWLGEPSQANPALIPRSRIDADGLAIRTGALAYAADYELINDNLCDFSHVAYVHEKTLAQGNDEWAQRRPMLTNLSDGVRVTRWIEGAQGLPVPGLSGDPVDLWMSYDYRLPGVLLMQIEYHPPGTAAARDFAPPTDLDEVTYAMRTVQAATPIAPGRSRYLYAVSLPVSPAPQALDVTFDMTAFAFLEDKAMIEAQQATIHRHPGVLLRNTAHDTALTRIRRLIRQRTAAEANRPAVAAA